MGIMKPLTPEEVPEEYIGRVAFLRQWTDKSPSGRTRAWVMVRCDVCDEMKQTPINDIRNFIRGIKKGNFPGTHRACRYKGNFISRDGYVRTYIGYDNEKQKSLYRPEHRIVMEKQLGRPLTDDETVHHINGDRQDNRPENLQLRTGRHGNGVVHECGDCQSRNIVAVELD